MLYKNTFSGPKLHWNVKAVWAMTKQDMPIIVQSCTREDLDRTLGSISLPRDWSNTGTRLLVRWLMIQHCQGLRGVWTMAFNNML